MGLVPRVRRRRAPSSLPHPPSSSLSSHSLAPPAPVPSPQRTVDPLGPAMYATVAPHRQSVTSQTSASSIPPSTSSRTTLLDTASRLRRAFRKAPRMHRPSQSHLAEHVPDTISAADMREARGRIAQYARSAASLPETSQPSWDNPIPTGDFVEKGIDVAPGVRCTDGCVSFVVPYGWVAARGTDGFCLFHGLAVGYVRATRANAASGALLETDRLQVIAQVKAASSPVFVGRDENRIFVKYSSCNGGGSGMAKFDKRNEAGAVVFALCGPKEDEAMIIRSMEDISSTIKLLAVPRESHERLDPGLAPSQDTAGAPNEKGGPKAEAPGVCLVM